MLVNQAQPLEAEIDALGAAPGPLLALDVGQRTGFAWSSGRCGTVDLSFCGDLGETCAHFHAWLSDALFNGRPRLLVLERPFGRGAFTSDLPIVLAGLAHMEAFRLKVPRRELDPSTVKKLVAGHGRAKKPEVVAAVRALGWAPDTDHAADAAAVLVAWLKKAPGGG